MGDYESDDDDYCDYEDDYDSDSIDDYQDDETEVMTPARSPSPKVITKESLLAAQREDLRRVMDLLSLKEHHARTLLIYHRWDVEKVFAALVEEGEERLFAKAGVKVEDKLACLQITSELTCNICFDEVHASETTTMDCGHCFCNDCWTEHFMVKISEGMSKRIRCMAYKCNTICDEGKISVLLKARNSDQAEKFDRLLLESYIDDNKRVKWCPSVPHCGNALLVEEDHYCEVECKCGLRFCFGCSLEPHSPCSCIMWGLWKTKCEGESQTLNWITVNTKPCPKCKKPMEKNGGCNHVTCLCGQSFCWLCGEATGKNHSVDAIEGHVCGRYKEEILEKTKDAEKALKRYLHYYSRYKAHTDSFKAEASRMEEAQKKISAIEEKESDSCKDFSWVMNGHYRLSRSRFILSYTYPFAYFMFGDELFDKEISKEEREIKQNLFEDQQQQLEANIERLSMALEELFDVCSDDEILEERMKVMDLTRLVDNLCRKMYECIENDLLCLPRTPHVIAPYRP